MTTIRIGSKDLRRRLSALTKLAPTDEDRPVLTHVLFRGGAAYVTDSYAIGIVPLPGEIEDDAVVPARRLRDALRVATGDEPVILTFTDELLELVIGDETLPFDDLADDHPAVRIPIDPEMVSGFPDLDALLDEEPADDPRVRYLALDGKRLGKLAALAPRGDDVEPDRIILRPRGPIKAVDVESIDGTRIGLIMPIRLGDDR